MLKPQGLITAIGVLAILGGYAWWANRHPTADKTSPAATSPKILSLTADQITGLRLVKPASDAVVLSKTGDKWQITAPQQLPADSDSVGALTNAVSPLTSDRLIDEHPQNLAEFGLDNPTEEVDITTKDGKTEKLLFGSDTVSGSDTYVKLASDPKVYTVASYAKSTLDKGVNDLRDKRLMTLNSDKITSVTLAAKGPAVEFNKNSSGDWQIVKPKPMRADSGAVDDLVSKLKDAKMDVSSIPTAADFDSATKLGTATFVDDKGPQSIEVRKAKNGDIYAKSTAVGGVYKVAPDIGTVIDKSAEDFRNKKLFDFGFTDPAKLDLAGKHYEKSGDKWFSGSQQIDSTSLQDVIDKLRDLSATSFPDHISGSPVLSLAVTWGEKSKVDKVTINKSGDNYIGVRDGDTTAYGLDAKSVDDLQKTIAAIKPAAPASGAKK
ncbi:MAG TPA: DUF4340 domain-containing protein [Bryobacteraceae bacterium]|nr:DUF4340 domain-containing protein [Bryobacteraceae bacterium]